MLPSIFYYMKLE